MKASDVPQDESMLGEHRRACYAVDDRGRYVIVPSKGWEVEKVVNGQAIGEIRQHIEVVRQRALRGEVSPLTFHMVRCQMTPGLLAANAGFWGWRTRRHLLPAGFARLNDAMLTRYAEALGMTLETLRQIPREQVTDE